MTTPKIDELILTRRRVSELSGVSENMICIAEQRGVIKPIVLHSKLLAYSQADIAAVQQFRASRGKSTNVKL